MRPRQFIAQRATRNTQRVRRIAYYVLRIAYCVLRLDSVSRFTFHVSRITGYGLRITNYRKAVAFAVTASLLLTACSLAGDVTPPPGSVSPIVQPSAPTLAAPAEVSLPGFPAEMPSAANGATVYTEHCIRCHGPAGAGDGELAGQLQFPPANFTDLELARSATPARWFQTVTQGNLDRFMPPFGESLSEAQRWDVTFYLYTLSKPQETIDAGQAVYEENCAECHGEGGRGDGPEAASTGAEPADFADPETLAAKSQADLFAAISDGVGQAMPAFAAELTEDERWAAAAYVRSFSYEYLAPGAEAAEAEGSIAGQVLNGTLGQPVTGDLDVVLYGFDDFQLATTITETLQPDGTFTFGQVPYAPGRSFMAVADYGGIPYSSDVVTFEGGADQIDLVLNVYETTTDPAGLHIDRMHVFLDFPASGVTIGELFIISNNGDRTVVGGTGLQFDLPEGAATLQMQGLTAGEDYLATPDGFTLTRSIAPGPNAAQLLISFTLPYSRGLEFAQVIPYPVATANVLVPDVGVRVSGDMLQSEGPQDVQGVRYLSYTASGLGAGSTLAFNLSGGVGAGGLPLSGDQTGLLIGGFTLALVVAAVGWWLVSRRAERAPQAAQAPAPRGAPPRLARYEPRESREDLLQALADLDDDFEAGEMPRAEYDRRRAALKARLVRIWER
jgi:mono/diheme cytochrome c family protein